MTSMSPFNQEIETVKNWECLCCPTPAHITKIEVLMNNMVDPEGDVFNNCVRKFQKVGTIGPASVM